MGRIGRGVALYVMDTLQSCVNNMIKTDNSVESIWVEVRKAAGKAVLGVVYRPPNLSKVDSIPIWQEINRACRYDQLCVLGDFDVRNIDLDLTVGDNDGEDLLKLVQDNFLSQIIREPTRADDILDLILTNGDDLVKEADVGRQLGNRDRCQIRCVLKEEKDFSSVSKHRIPDFRRANYEGLRRRLEGISWSRLEREGEIRFIGGGSR